MLTAPPQTTDAEIIRRISSGDENALVEFYDRYRSIVFGLLIRILRNRAEAEEILQDVFVQVWQRAANYDERRGRVFTWLIMIAHSRAFDRLRSTGSRIRVSEKFGLKRDARPNSLIPNSADDLLHKERRRFVQTALDELPEKQRQVLLMSFFDGFSQSEIAALTNAPLGTVKTQMRTGMIKLRQNLSLELSAYL